MTALPCCFDCGSHEIVHLPDQDVCAECGVVQHFQIVSDAPEWRNFDDGKDHSRVGCPDGNLQTQIAHGGKHVPTATVNELKRTHMRTRPASSYQLVAFYRVLKLYTDRMDLAEGTVEVAKTIGKDFLTIRGLRGEKHLHSLVATCIYYACNDLRKGYWEPEQLLPWIDTFFSGNTHSMREHLYHMLGLVYKTLLNEDWRKYNRILKIATDADQIRKAIRTLQGVPQSMVQLIYKKVLQIRYYLENEQLDMQNHVLDALLIRVGCSVYNVQIKKKDFCKDLNISQTTLCNKERLFRSWVERNQASAKLFLRP
jgi:hypothetical protein